METENKMAYEPINTLILQMSAPPLISMFLQYSYNLVDSMFVAKINEQALAAVSLSFPITTLMNALSIWIGVGVNVLIAGYLGQDKQEKADSAATLGLLLSVLVGAAVTAAALLTIKPYYTAFTQNSAIFAYGLSYMKVCAYMQLPNMVHIAIQKMLQATGNMIAPMWFQIAGVLFNFVFDPLLIFGIGPFPQMGLPEPPSQRCWGIRFPCCSHWCSCSSQSRRCGQNGRGIGSTHRCSECSFLTDCHPLS